MIAKQKLIFVIAAVGAGCGQTVAQAPSAVESTSLLFVHGAFQNAAVWDTLRETMERRGVKTEAVDLPRETTTTGPKLNDYVQQIIDRGRSMKSPTWLVVHSFGGMHGTLAVATPGEPFEGIVYVAAYAPTPGESMQALAARDATNRFSDRNFLVAKDYKYASVLLEDRAMLFCNDCGPQLAQRVANDMVPEPLGPVGEAVDFEPAELSDDKVAYIFTTKDHAVGTQLQRQMAARAGIKMTAEVATGHTPFLTKPEELADRIIEFIEANR